MTISIERPLAGSTFTCSACWIAGLPAAALVTLGGQSLVLCVACGRQFVTALAALLEPLIEDGQADYAPNIRPRPLGDDRDVVAAVGDEPWAARESIDDAAAQAIDDWYHNRLPGYRSPGGKP